jgi:hypothetical protein
MLFMGLSAILNTAAVQAWEVTKAREGNELFGGFFYPKKGIEEKQKDSHRFWLKVWGILAVAMSVALICISLYETARWAGWLG